ncbi:MAG: nuclear transport factor 2 family protein [Solirubrobacterales bacterium]
MLELLSPDIIWHVPGISPIAGDHRGFAQVVEYFERRRRLASTTMRMRPGVANVYGNAVVQCVEGTAVLNREPVSWQTLGIYCIAIEQAAIREAWLVPLDSDLFDRIWSGFN